MISLFETTQKEKTPTSREVYLKRLHEIAYDPNGKSSEPATATAPDPAVEAPPETVSAETVAEMEIKTIPQLPGTLPFPAVEPFSFQGEMKVGAMEEAATLDSRKLAEEIAPKFVDAFVVAFDEMERHALGSNSKASEAAAELSRASQDLQALNGQVGAIRRAIDSLAAAQRELSTRVSNIEAGLREHEKINLNLEAGMKQSEQALKAQQGLLTEKLNTVAEQAAPINERLDAQANAIRSLHRASPDHLGHRDDLRSTLQKIQEIAGKLSTPGSLPGKL
ncbi:MAG: hypothetical protein ACM3JD_02580 [Rudaea sp.]